MPLCADEALLDGALASCATVVAGADGVCPVFCFVRKLERSKPVAPFRHIGESPAPFLLRYANIVMCMVV